MSLFLKCNSSKLHLMALLESDQMWQSSCQSQPSEMQLLLIGLHPYLLSWVLRDFRQQILSKRRLLLADGLIDATLNCKVKGWPTTQFELQ